MDAMDCCDDSEDEYMSKETLENILDGSQYHSSVNRRVAHYKIRDRMKQIQLEWKGAFKATQTRVKFYIKFLRLL